MNRWLCIHEDLRAAIKAFYDGDTFNGDEKNAMIDCVEEFVELLKYAHISSDGYQSRRKTPPFRAGDIRRAVFDLY